MDIKRMFALILSVLMLTGCSEPSEKVSEYSEVTSGVTDSDLPYYGTTARTRATLPEPEIEESPLVPPEPPEVTFTGFDLSEIGETPKLGNIASNICNRVYSGIVCPDYERGCAYITAVGYDNKLHKFIDGKDSGVLADCTAWALNIWDGMLYCIMDSDNKVFQMLHRWHGYAGDVYRIDPATGEMELIISTDAVDLVIADGMLHYVQKELSADGSALYRTYCCTLDGAVTDSFDMRLLGFCGKYMVVTDNPFCYYAKFYDPVTKELIPFTEERVCYSFMLSDNGKAYYGGVMELDLATGREREINPPYDGGWGYVKMGDDVYSAAENVFVTHIEYPREKTTKYWTCYESPVRRKRDAALEKGGYGGFYGSMLTDGSRIYVVEANDFTSTAVIKELLFDSDTKTCEERTLL